MLPEPGASNIQTAASIVHLRRVSKPEPRQYLWLRPTTVPSTCARRDAGWLYVQRKLPRMATLCSLQCGHYQPTAAWSYLGGVERYIGRDTR